VLLPIFEWANGLTISQTINEAGWLFALIQAGHLVALAVLAGALLVVDLRLLGAGLTAQPVSAVARGARPWLVSSLAVMVATGVPQLVSLAEKEYYSDYFWAKMYFLAAATAFTFTVRRTATRRAEVGRIWGGLVGLVSIVLWSGVAVSARLIGLF
jgi:hypothetical protein